MKRLFIAIFTLLLLYSIYYDLTSGSLPTKETKNVAVPVTNMSNNDDFFEATVKPGDTVLSIMEKHLKEPLPVSITKLITDFQALNKGKQPEEIQIGKRYKFPNY
jgi:hypothetical protein